MAEIQYRSPTGKTKRKLHAQLSIDMTPMVDLGFLLITFFVFTTSMAEKRAMHLIMPKDGEPTGLAESKAITAILGGNNKVFVYAGKWDNAVSGKNIAETNYNVYQGLGIFVRAKQKQLKNKRNDLMLLVKPLNDASYQNVIKALDEALINDVRRYAIVQATVEEKQYIQRLQNVRFSN
ncbi:MAG: ExbD/TolR family protein [Flavisolibacter sp.]